MIKFNSIQYFVLVERHGVAVAIVGSLSEALAVIQVRERLSQPIQLHPEEDTPFVISAGIGDKGYQIEDYRFSYPYSINSAPRSVIFAGGVILGFAETEQEAFEIWRQQLLQLKDCVWEGS